MERTFPLYILIGATFLLSLLYAIALPRINDLWSFSFFQILVDVAYATVLIHFTGGASSTFSLLYVFPIVASGVLHFRRGALLTAAIASLAFGLLLILEFYRMIPGSIWPWTSSWKNYDPGFVLWVLVVHFTVFLLVAVLAGSIAEQLKNTRISLSLRDLAFENLSDLHTSIVESIPSGILTTDEGDRVSFVNNVGLSILGMTSAQVNHLPLSRVFSEFHKPGFQHLNGTTAFTVPHEVNSNIRLIHCAVTILKERDATPKGRLLVFQDITEIKRMEERARNAEKQASFVRIAAGMAHEIKNPLASIRGASELLTQPVVDSGNRHLLLGIVIRESDRLNSLLNDFIATVSIPSSSRVPLLLDQVIDELAEEYQKDVLADRGISIVRDLQKGLQVDAEPDKLKQAVMNVLVNAADASSRDSEIRVTLAREQEEAIIRVQDFGHGIPPAWIDRVFEPFATTKEFGTGLGLPMALTILEAHGGGIDLVESNEKGSIFVMHIPLASEGSVLVSGEGAHD